MKQTNPSAEKYMRLALKLARRADGRTSPNPLVGAVVVKKGRIIGRGYHHRAGTPHAEILALAQAGNDASGADLYLNLEPCSHFGRTPPCADAVIQAGLGRVFVGMLDPNPVVNGAGVRKLRQAGIQVETGILEDACRRVNESFIKYITTRRPFVTLKAAASLDGKIATVTGDSKWISGEASRQYVHRLRNRVDAVLVGIGTIQQDDPWLTTRLKDGGGKDPIRIVVDTALRISPQARVFNAQSSAPTLVVTTPKAPRDKIKVLEARGGRVLVIPSEDRVDLGLLMEKLGEEQVTSLLIEGGSRINASALQAGIVDKVVFFFAPRIIGGERAPAIVGGSGVQMVNEAISLEHIRVRRFGEDVMIEGYVHKEGLGR